MPLLISIPGGLKVNHSASISPENTKFTKKKQRVVFIKNLMFLNPKTLNIMLAAINSLIIKEIKKLISGKSM